VRRPISQCGDKPPCEPSNIWRVGQGSRGEVPRIHVNAKGFMGHCLKELEELREDVPMAEAGESASMRWRETDAKRVRSGADNEVRNSVRKSPFMSETKWCCPGSNFGFQLTITWTLGIVREVGSRHRLLGLARRGHPSNRARPGPRRAALRGHPSNRARPGPRLASPSNL
jgi:hypothetical protein